MRMAGPREAVWHGLIRTQPRLHPLHRRPRPCRPRQELGGRGFLRPLRRAGAVPRAPGRDRHRDGRLQAHGLRAGARPVRARRRDRRQGRRHDPQHLGHRAAPPPAGRAGDPRVVLLPRGGHGAAPHPPAAGQAGLHRVLHRLLRLGQVHHRQRADGQADGDGRPPGDAAGRRHRAQEPLLRAGLLQGAPRPQHPPHRLCRLRDHQERRHRHLRADRALRGHPPRRARG